MKKTNELAVKETMKSMPARAKKVKAGAEPRLSYKGALPTQPNTEFNLKL